MRLFCLLKQRQAVDSSGRTSNASVQVVKSVFNSKECEALWLCWFFTRKDLMKTKARFLVIAAFCLACLAALLEDGEDDKEQE